MSKRQHKSLSLQDKIDIIKLLESGEKQAKIAVDKGLSKSTICEISKNRDVIKEQHEKGDSWFEQQTITTKRQHKSFTLQDKIDIIKLLESGVKQAKIAVDRGLSKSTICDISKNRDFIKEQYEKLNSDRKKVRKAVYGDIDEALLQWYTAARTANIPLSSVIVLERAKEFAKKFGKSDFRGSIGWLYKWRKRHGIIFDGSVNDIGLEDWLKNKWPQLSNGFEENDIFNCDETGLYYKVLPGKSLHFKNHRCEGGKNSNVRITVLLATNSTGSEKLKPLVIGKFKNPQPFQTVKMNSLPVEYFYNEKSWMTAEIFGAWIHRLDKKMGEQKRRILLTLDSCMAHPQEIKHLKNIKLVFFPANCASKVQPCDQGIIYEVKKIYRSIILKKILSKLDNNMTPDINILEAIFEISSSWNQLAPSIIKNCFRLSGIVKPQEKLTDDIEMVEYEENVNDDDDDVLLSELANKLRIERSNLPSFKEYVDCDAKLEICGLPTVDEIVEEFQAKVNKCTRKSRYQEDSYIPRSFLECTLDTSDVEEEFEELQTQKDTRTNDVEEEVEEFLAIEDTCTSDVEDDVEEAHDEVMSCADFLECVNQMKHFIACQVNVNEKLYQNLNELENFVFSIKYKSKKGS